MSNHSVQGYSQVGHPGQEDIWWTPRCMTVQKTWTCGQPASLRDLCLAPWSARPWLASLPNSSTTSGLCSPNRNQTVCLFRFGDRFWYENGGWPSSFTLEQLEEIRSVKLSRVICDNSDTVEDIQVDQSSPPPSPPRCTPWCCPTTRSTRGCPAPRGGCRGST